MKIKRFEASSMSDALRMVKKDFGEEAVILSAKTVSKSNRIFGKRSGGKVIVTAAIDDALPQTETKSSETSDQWQLPDLSDVLQEASQKPLESNRTILERFTPITRTGKQKLGPKLVRLMSESKNATEPSKKSVDMTLYPFLSGQGLDEELASELAALAEEMLPSESTESEQIEALAQVIETKSWIAASVHHRAKDRRIVVLVGPGGAGKTATAAKLAAHAILSLEHTVAFLSLDNQRVGGTDELARLAAVMGLELEVAMDPGEVSAAMQRMAQAQLIVVDTPGLVPDDTAGRARLEQMIAALPDPEVHLLINAGCQEGVISRAVRFYKALGVDRLLPTHLDWNEQIGPFVNQLSRYTFPMTYLGSGIRVPEDLHPATCRNLAMRLLGLVPEETQTSEPDPEVTVVRRRMALDEAGPKYVANRNSDIFHQTDCKSVQRISEANALMFKDSNEALAQGFKPCRMCCSEHIVLKPIDRLARTRYAGSRN